MNFTKDYIDNKSIKEKLLIEKLQNIKF